MREENPSQTPHSIPIVHVEEKPPSAIPMPRIYACQKPADFIVLASALLACKLPEIALKEEPFEDTELVSERLSSLLGKREDTIFISKNYVVVKNVNIGDDVVS